MKIKVKLKNIAKLDRAINAVQTRSTVRHITGQNICDAILRIDRRLSDLMYKKDWEGLKIVVNANAQTFSRNYIGSTPEATIFTVERTAAGWFVTSIHRGGCGTSVYTLNLHNYAEEIALYVSGNFGKV